MSRGLRDYTTSEVYGMVGHLRGYTPSGSDLRYHYHFRPFASERGRTREQQHQRPRRRLQRHLPGRTNALGRSRTPVSSRGVAIRLSIRTPSNNSGVGLGVPPTSSRGRLGGHRCQMYWLSDPSLPLVRMLDRIRGSVLNPSDE